MIRRVQDILYLSKFDLKRDRRDTPFNQIKAADCIDWKQFRDADVIIFIESNTIENKTTHHLIKSIF